MSRLDTLVADAAQARAAGEPLPSPCLQLCRVDARRLEEIGGWMTMDEDARWAVWQRIAQRRATAPPTRP